MSKITSSQIKNHNDLLRTTFFPYLGKVMLTSGVNDHPKKEEAITKVREFVDFTPDNDPHGEHDFGSFKIDGEEFFFKIDYFSDHTFQYGADPYEQPVVRVLTILLASEY
jgi:hypothetical protein